MKKKKESVGLKLALPNGSLEEGTMRLFEESNLKIWKDPRKHDARIDDPLISQVVFVRPQHIPRGVEQGIYDLGICGLDCVVESMANVGVMGELPYGRGNSLGRTQVVLFASEEMNHSSIEEVSEHSRILTEYPSITQDAFKRVGISVQVEFSYGGTEALVPSYAPYGVCITDTGQSLLANRKKIISVLICSYTALIGNPHALQDKSNAIKALHLHLSGALSAREKVLLKMNVPTDKKDAILKILPALNSPTISVLSDGTSFAMESVVPKKNSTALIIQLAQAGAKGIIELPITKMVQNW